MAGDETKKLQDISIHDNFVEASRIPFSINKEPVGNGYCVAFVQNNGFEHLRGDANVWIQYINSDTPSVGSVVVLDEGEIGHIAIVLMVYSDSILIAEQNYFGRWIVDERELSLDYERIIGYIL